MRRAAVSEVSVRAEERVGDVRVDEGREGVHEGAGAVVEDNDLDRQPRRRRRLDVGERSSADRLGVDLIEYVEDGDDVGRHRRLGATRTGLPALDARP